MPHSGKIFEAKKKEHKSTRQNPKCFPALCAKCGPKQNLRSFLGRPALMPWLQHQELPGGNPDGHCGIF